MAITLQLAAASQSCFQTASVKRIANSKHMRCHEVSPPPQTLHAGALSGMSLKYRSESGPVIQIAVRKDQDFSSTLALGPARIPFSKEYSRANVLCDEIQGLFTFELSGTRKQTFLREEFGHTF